MADNFTQVFNDLFLWQNLFEHKLKRLVDFFNIFYLLKNIEWKIGNRPIGNIPEFPVRWDCKNFLNRIIVRF